MLKKIVIVLFFIGSSSSLFSMKRKNNPHSFAKPQRVPVSRKGTSERDKIAENTTYNRKKRDEQCCECIMITIPSCVGALIGGCYAHSLQEDTISSKEIGSFSAVGAIGGAAFGSWAYNVAHKRKIKKD